jgi:hypothetical protein
MLSNTGRAADEKPKLAADNLDQLDPLKLM